MYCGVPIATPRSVIGAALVAAREAISALAIPKSATAAVLSVSRMLSGLMSRCTTPLECANSNARATSLRILTATRIGIAPARRRRTLRRQARAPDDTRRSGWFAAVPEDRFPRLQRSPQAKPIVRPHGSCAAPAWSEPPDDLVDERAGRISTGLRDPAASACTHVVILC